MSNARMIGNFDKTNNHRPECECKSCLIPYLFFRADGFYIIELNGDAVARENARCNPGTLRVKNAITLREVWNESVAAATEEDAPDKQALGGALQRVISPNA